MLPDQSRQACTTAVQSAAGERDRRHQGVFGLARVQPRVLHHDGYVGFDHARVRRVLRDRLGLGERVEPQVPHALRPHHECVRANGFAILECTVIAMLASVAPALRRQQASWLSISGDGPWLRPGIYPSAIARRWRPTSCMPTG